MNNQTPFVKLAIEILTSSRFIVVFVSILAALSPMILISDSAGGQHERYLTMSTLGANMKAGEYFSSNNTINIADNITWYIRVYNGMNDSEYLCIKVKLLNSTQMIPNDVTNTPSPYSEIFKIRQLVPINSTSTVPLEWSITDIEEQNGYVSIRKMMINGQELDNIDIRSLDGNDFRIVLELWKYDIATKDFNFEWSSGHDQRSVWNQIWFNVKN
jgi:hypothetical protein